MVPHPGVNLEHMLVKYDDVLSICYEALDLPGLHDWVRANRGRGRHLRAGRSHLGKLS